MSKQNYTYVKELGPAKQTLYLVDDYIHFYQHERIQIKTGVVPLSLCYST